MKYDSNKTIYKISFCQLNLFFLQFCQYKHFEIQKTFLLYLYGGYCHCVRYGFKSFILFISIRIRLWIVFWQTSFIISMLFKSRLSTTSSFAVQKSQNVNSLHNFIFYNFFPNAWNFSIIFFCTYISTASCSWFKSSFPEALVYCSLSYLALCPAYRVSSHSHVDFQLFFFPKF